MERERGPIKSSLPVVFELENDEFFVLSFGNEGEDREFGSKGRRSEMGSGKLMRRKAERCKNKDNENQEPNKVVSNEKMKRRIN